MWVSHTEQVQCQQAGFSSLCAVDYSNDFTSEVKQNGHQETPKTLSPTPDGACENQRGEEADPKAGSQAGVALRALDST